MEDIIGKKFGRLTVLEKTDKKCCRVNYFKCKCDCGNEKSVLKNHLISGHTQSCGCITKDINHSKFENYKPLKNNIENKNDYIVLKIESKGKIYDCFIDLEDYEKIENYRWCITNKYVYNNNAGFLHRFIMDCKETKLQVDHINHNKLDNRKCNLRICTNQQNNLNKKVKGYYWNKRNKNWNAEIRINGKKIFLGVFKTEEEAKEARRQAEIKYFGEFRYKD